MESEEAQDPQMILGDPLQRLPDEAHPSRRQIIGAAEKIINLATHRIGRERIDREVPAGGVLAPIVGIGDRRPPPIGRDVAPERCDLDRTVGEHRRHGAMGDAGRDRLETRRRDAIPHLRRRQGRRAVDIGNRQAEQRVAYRAADIAGSAPGRIEGIQKRLKPPPLAPRSQGQYHR
jgi:hypothetical protein